MKQFYLILLFINLALTTTFSQQDMIILNEVGTGNIDFFEIKNLTNQDFDPSDLFIIYNGNSRAMNTVSAICAFPQSNLVIDAGEQQGFIFSGLSNEGGELVLSTVENPVQADELLDYVIWGNGIATYQNLAVESNLWVDNSVATDFFEAGSIEFDGEGNMGTDWLLQAQPSPCKENGSNCDVRKPTIFEEEFFVCTCDGSPENLDYSYNGGTETVLGIIVNRDSIVQYVSNESFITTFEDDFCSSDSLFFMTFGYDGEVRGFEVGASLNAIEGCFVFSDMFPLNTLQVDDYTYALVIDGLEINPSFNYEICPIDAQEEQLSIASSSAENVAHFIFNDGGIILDQFEGHGATYDYSDLAPGIYNIISFAYKGTLGDSEGYFYLDPNIDGCYSTSGDQWSFTILEANVENCTSGTYDLYSIENLGFELKQRNRILNISTGALVNLRSKLDIYAVQGQKVLSQNLTPGSNNAVNLNYLNSGVYVVSIYVNDASYSGMIYVN